MFYNMFPRKQSPEEDFCWGNIAKTTLTDFQYLYIGTSNDE